MHISDGVLSAKVLLAGAAVAAGGTAVGLRKIDMEKMPRVAVLSSAFFVASLIHVPLGPSSVHLLLNGITGLLLGWASFPAILIGLLFQALLFQYGGLTVLGVNTVNMALPGLLVFFLFHRIVKNKNGAASMVCSFLSGALAVFLSAIMTAFTLVFSGDEFVSIAKLLIAAHLPIMLIEGVVSVFVISLLKKVKPEMLEVPYALSHSA